MNFLALFDSIAMRYYKHLQRTDETRSLDFYYVLEW